MFKACETAVLTAVQSDFGYGDGHGVRYDICSFCSYASVFAYAFGRDIFWLLVRGKTHRDSRLYRHYIEHSEHSRNSRVHTRGGIIFERGFAVCNYGDSYALFYAAYAYFCVFGGVDGDGCHGRWRC